MSNDKIRLVGRVDALPSGRFRFRTEIGGRTQSQTFDTEPEAQAYRLEVSRELAAIEAKPRHRRTLAEFGAKFFRGRRADREVRDVDGEEQRWAHHIAETKLGRSPLDAITPATIKTWYRDECARPIKYPYSHPRNGQLPSRGTIKKALVILRLCLDEAVEDELISSNPARSFRLKRTNVRRTHEPWTYLDLDEQHALLAGPEDELHDLITFAMYVACRQGEQWNLELSDVHPGKGVVVLRFGSAGGATKTGKIRTVPLMGPSLAAVERQIARLALRDNPHGLLWPREGGGRRLRGELPEGFRERVVSAGIVRRFRWYDLRHTGASSLVSGWWGRAWSLQEVRDLLGHSTATMTERYAHLAPSALEAAAKGTPGALPPRRRLEAEGAEDRPGISRSFNPSVQGSSPCRPTRKNKAKSLAGHDEHDGGETASLAAEVVLAIRDDDADAFELARRLAEAVLEDRGVRFALDILDGDRLWAHKALSLAAVVLGDVGALGEEASS